MKNRLKGLLSLILSLTMLIGITAVPVYAEGLYANDLLYVYALTDKPVDGETEIPQYSDSNNSLKELTVDSDGLTFEELKAQVTKPQGVDNLPLIEWEFWGAALTSGGVAGMYYSMHDMEITYPTDTVFTYTEMNEMNAVLDSKFTTADNDKIQDVVPTLVPVVIFHQINPQPTTEDPTAVGQTWNDDKEDYADDETAEYQWYEVSDTRPEEATVEYTVVQEIDVDLEELGHIESGDVNDYECSYFCTDGVWTLKWDDSDSEGYYLYLDINLTTLEAGDILTIKFEGENPFADEEHLLYFDGNEDNTPVTPNSELSNELTYAYTITDDWTDNGYYVEINYSQLKEKFQSSNEPISFTITVKRDDKEYTVIDEILTYGSEMKPESISDSKVSALEVDGEGYWTITWNDETPYFYNEYILKKGDVITVTFPDGNPLIDENSKIFYMYDAPDGEDYFQPHTVVDDRTFSYTVPEDGRYSTDLSYENIREDLLEVGDTLRFKTTITRTLDESDEFLSVSGMFMTRLEGETDSTLTETSREAGKTYICRVTFPNGDGDDDDVVLWSNTVTYNYSSGAPTDDDPTFDLGLFRAGVRAMLSRTYEINATAGEGGAISPAGETTARYNGIVKYTITPDEGYVLADVLVDGVSVGAVSSYSFGQIRDDHTIHAVFEKAE